MTSLGNATDEDLPEDEPRPFSAHLQHELAPIVLLAGFMLLLGAFFRIENFGFPTNFQFDEHHFVENARNYIAGRADWNDHPPLGKLFIAAAIALGGDKPVMWRLPSLVFGVATIVFAATASARLFHSRLAALLCAGLASIDGFLVAYSRAALLDGTICAMSVLSLLAATLELRWLVLVGLLSSGIAMSVKFSGVAALVAPIVGILLRRLDFRTRAGAIALLVVGSGAVYVASYWLGFALLGQRIGFAPVVNETRRLLEHHASLTDMKNAATSSWPTWILPAKPIMLGLVHEHRRVRAMTSLGNLALWWSAFAVALSTAGVLVWRGIKSTLTDPPPPNRRRAEGPVLAFVSVDGRAAVITLAAVLAFLAPWVLSRRDSYIYHFLPSYAVMLVLLAGFVHRQLEKWPRAVFLFLASSVLVAAFFGPLWCYLPVTEAAFDTRLFLLSWR